MTHDEIEFLISQHFDGTLDAEEAQKLRAAVDADPAVRSLFDEHARLDAALKGSRSSLDIDDEWLTAQIAGRIDEQKSRPLQISRWSIFAPMAVAATLLIGLTLGIVFLKDGAETTVSPPLAKTVEVSVPQPTRRNITTVSHVSVGVPSNLTPAMMTTLFLADQRSSGRIVIQPAGEVRGGPFD